MDLLATRRQLLAGGAGVGVAGAVLLRSASGLGATTKGAPTTEPQRIQRLLSVELLLVYCYQQVIASSLVGPAQRRVLTPLLANEQAHVRALSRALKQLGGVQPAAPRTLAEANKDLSHRKIGGRLGQLKNTKDALYLLLSAERVAVGAYFVALAKLESRSLITLSAEIMANDAQHEALIGELLNHGKTAEAVPYGLVQGVQ